MPEVDIISDTLVIRMTGWDKLWALKRRIQIPIAHVRGVRLADDIARGPKGWRFPGTYLPGVITAGTFYRNGERTFWAVHDPNDAIAIDLINDRFNQMVVGVDYPEDTVSAIQQAIQGAAIDD